MAALSDSELLAVSSAVPQLIQVTDLDLSAVFVVSVPLRLTVMQLFDKLNALLWEWLD